jgi:hypothetical protein
VGREPPVRFACQPRGAFAPRSPSQTFVVPTKCTGKMKDLPRHPAGHRAAKIVAVIAA